MLLEQITTDYDMQEPAPKGMVRTEMGRLVKKADQDAWMKKEAAAMQAQLKSRGASSLKEKKVGAALKTMKKELPAAKKKTAMDGLKALGKYVSTFGFATEKYNPAPKK